MTEVAAANYYCMRGSWIDRVLQIRRPPSDVMLRGSAFHFFYEVMERDMLALVKRHKFKTTPEVIIILRDHLIECGLKEFVPDQVKEGAEGTKAKMFVVTLAEEVACAYVTTYYNYLYHAPSNDIGTSGIIVREIRRHVPYKGYVVSGKPDWIQYTGPKTVFSIDYKTGAPKVPDLYQVVQGSGYRWLLHAALDVEVLFHILFWAGYHKFAVVPLDSNPYTKRLDDYIAIIESGDPPPYCKVPECAYCHPVRRAICKERR